MCIRHFALAVDGQVSCAHAVQVLEHERLSTGSTTARLLLQMLSTNMHRDDLSRHSAICSTPATMLPSVTGTRFLHTKSCQVTSAPRAMPMGTMNMLATLCCIPHNRPSAFRRYDQAVKGLLRPTRQVNRPSGRWHAVAAVQWLRMCTSSPMATNADMGSHTAMALPPSDCAAVACAEVQSSVLAETG